jgi:uncharacterized membrane protein
MKPIFEFHKTSVIGGLVVLLPVGLVGIVLKKAIGAATAVAGPLAVKLAGSTHFATPTLLVLIVAGCCLTGLLARTSAGNWVLQKF